MSVTDDKKNLERYESFMSITDNFST